MWLSLLKRPARNTSHLATPAAKSAADPQAACPSCPRAGPGSQRPELRGRGRALDAAADVRPMPPGRSGFKVLQRHRQRHRQRHSLDHDSGWSSGKGREPRVWVTAGAGHRLITRKLGAGSPSLGQPRYRAQAARSPVLQPLPLPTSPGIAKCLPGSTSPTHNPGVSDKEPSNAPLSVRDGEL